jgi:hypothetical protein
VLVAVDDLVQRVRPARADGDETPQQSDALLVVPDPIGYPAAERPRSFGGRAVGDLRLA